LNACAMVGAVFSLALLYETVPSKYKPLFNTASPSCYSMVNQDMYVILNAPGPSSSISPGRLNFQFQTHWI
jgi:hypothetical protein